MLEELKIMLGAAASNFSDEELGLALKMALVEVETYCNRTHDYEMLMIAQRIAVIHLSRQHSDGLASWSGGGVNETYIDGYPADIMAVLNRKRRIKTL